MFKTILLPLDFAQESSWKKALPVALALREAYGASLHLVNVVPNYFHGGMEQYFPPDYEQKLIDDAKASMAAFIAEHLAGKDAKGHIVQGPIYHRIIETAENVGADLIVMASHRPGLADYLIGPNAARVATHTPRSVMIVRD